MNGGCPADPNRPGSQPSAKRIVLICTAWLTLAGLGLTTVLYLTSDPSGPDRRPATQRRSPATPQPQPPPRAAVDADPPVQGPAVQTPDSPMSAASVPAVPAAPEQATPAPHSHRPARADPKSAAARDGLAAQPSGAARDGTIVARLTPLEIVAAEANSNDWRGSRVIAGQTYADVIAVRPPVGEDVAQIAFALDGRFVRLAGFVAVVADGAPPEGADQRPPRVEFRIYGDGNLLWEDQSATAIDARQPVSCDVRGIAVLTLVAESESAPRRVRWAWGDLVLTPVTSAAHD